MTKLAETYVRLNIRLEKADQLRFQSHLNRRSAAYADGLFQQAPQIVVDLKDGSLRVWIRVAGAIYVAAGSLYVAIGQYGDFRSGLDAIAHDAREFSEKVLKDVEKSGIDDTDILRFERRLGVPGRIRRLSQEIEKLKREGPHLSKEEFETRIDTINKRLHDVLKAIDNEADRKFVVANLKPEVRSLLPTERKKHRPLLWTSAKLVRPKEWSEADQRSLFGEPTEIVKSRPRRKPEVLYRFTESGTGFRLIPTNG